MPKYENLYLISPALFVSEIEKDIDEIRTRQNHLEETISTFKGLVEKILESKVRDLSNSAVFVNKWHYDVRFPNYTLKNVYDMEKANGSVKRWVGPERFVELSLLLNRSTQYTFETNIINFIKEELRDIFSLTVNGDEIPWISISEDNMWYKTIIPEDYRSKTSDTTRIVLGCREGVEPVTVQGDQRTLWFSLSSIDIKAY